MIAFCDNKIVVMTALILMMLGRATVGGGQCLMPPELSKGKNFFNKSISISLQAYSQNQPPLQTTC